MKMLVISFHYPPDQVMGANRPARTVEFLISQGHDVRVISAAKSTGLRNQPDDGDGQVLLTSWFDILRLKIRRGGVAELQANDSAAETPEPGPGLRAGARETKRRARRRVAKLYDYLVVVPDSAVGWIPFAIAEGKRSFRSWRPDVILASGAPFSAFVIAAALGKRFRIPWVADYRDPWTGSPYYRFSGIRKVIDSHLESVVCRTASLMITVSEPIADALFQQHGVPVEVVRNGFDDVTRLPLDERGALSDARVNILYVGNSLYDGRHDPTPLFRAAKSLELSPADIRFHFLGTDPAAIVPQARDVGVDSLVMIHPVVDRRESLALQSRADYLLLLLWDDPRSVGVYSGKLFEYIGARRPILFLGYADGVAANVIVEQRLGHVVTSDLAAEQILNDLCVSKTDAQILPDLPLDDSSPFSRDSQTAHLERCLEQTLANWNNSQRIHHVGHVSRKI